jgi:divalent metal cation (Fe/Co/Zn/Cd) transporter
MIMKLLAGYFGGSEAVRKLAESVADVKLVHEIRCCKSGQYLIVDLKLDMNPEITVRESHAISDAVKNSSSSAT